MSTLGREELWQMLIETAKANLMYMAHKRFLQDVMIKETPKISPQELAVQLNVTMGEALVLLYEIRGDNLEKPSKSLQSNKTPTRSLLDFRE